MKRGILIGLTIASLSGWGADRSKQLQAMDWMTGGTWTAEAKAANGPATKVESRIRWSPNGHAIEFVTSFNGHEHYNGIYAWDPAQQAVRFFYTSGEGEFTSGTAKPVEDGLEQEFDITGVDGKANHFRSAIKKTGPDDYDWNVQRQENGEWAVMIKLHYTRK